MELFNIGPLELIIILVLMFIILGPKDMVKTAQRTGAWVRSVTRSPMWREVWGISQDIRELPKKLMDETGLDEALTDVKQTTQEVANELNTQINEAKEAARVPEAEHVRIEPNPQIGPPANSVPAAVHSPVEPPVRLEAVQPAELKVVEATESEAAAPGETGEAGQPVVVAAQDTAEPVPVKKPRRTKKQAQAVESLPEETPAAEASTDAASAVLAEVEASQGELSLTEPSAPFWPGTPFFPLDSPDRVLVVPTPAPPPTNGQSGTAEVRPAQESPPAEPAATPRQRKRRAPQAVSSESVVLEPTTSTPESGNGAAKPARVRKPRQPKAAAMPPVEPEPGAAEPQPEANPATPESETQPAPETAPLDRDAA